ncbi:MAG: S8 family serine peptidase [Pseudomonadota bacterium]
MARALSVLVLFFVGVTAANAVDLQPANPAPASTLLTDITPNAEFRDQVRTYVVQMRDRPAVSYDGSIPGFVATAPQRGEVYDADASHVQAYTSHLIASHDQALAEVGGYDKIYSYCHTMNGFAARLTPEQAEALKAHGSVLNVWEDYAVEINTNDTSEFLGLTNRRDGLRSRLRLQGEDIIIGVMDTGAVQEHPSFADTLDFELPSFCANPKTFFGKWVCHKLTKLQNEVVYDAPPAKWSGICEPGEGWSEEDCNNKLIGARWYVDGFIAGAGSVVEGEFLSPRDSSGHGSHTASTAGGNDVIARLNGTRVGRISGMAPRARLAIYKTCWLAPGATNFSCFFSDSAAATDQAVADGVDVLNFSVGTAPSFVDTQDLAFLDASNAGVFVARSGGNDGPGFGTINAGEPWVTSVAASTTDGVLFRFGTAINSPASVAGNYIALEGAITQPISESGDVTANVGVADPIEACEPLTNDLTGKIALIARGTCGFVDKVESAVGAGAVGVIVYTDEERPIVIMGGEATEISQSIPGVMIEFEPGIAILAELEASNKVNASINDTTFAEEERNGNVMAGFSSRGPFFTEQNWIKPDITAPGVQILAAYTPDLASGEEGDLFDYLSGTSMSGPHIAGLGALIKEARPDWSPAQIKSALMTTARQDVVKEDGETPADPFDFGAGHVVPNKAVSPGLTYDAGNLDYLAASCGTVSPIPGLTPEACEFIETELGLSTDPADLNLPSIGIDQIAGSQTITRTVTAVGDYRKYGRADNRRQKYKANIEAPPGFDVSVAPQSLSLRPGETATYELTVTNQTSAPNVWQFGALTWENQRKRANDVRSPIAVNALAFITEDELDLTGPAGSAQFDLTFGYTGEYTALAHGINPAQPVGFIGLTDDPTDQFSFRFGDPSLFSTFIEDTQPGTAFRRFSTYDAYTTGNDDLDLYLYYCADGATCNLIDSSAGPGSDESVEVLLPVPFDPTIGFVGNVYILFIHAFDAETGETTVIYYDGQFGINNDVGNLLVTAPGAAESNVTTPVTVEWGGLPQGLLQKQIGAVSHSDANGIQNLTILDIQNDEGASICDLGVCP